MTDHPDVRLTAADAAAQIAESMRALGIDREDVETSDERVLIAALDLARKNKRPVRTNEIYREVQGIHTGTIDSAVRRLVSRGQLLRIDRGRYLPSAEEVRRSPAE